MTRTLLISLLLTGGLMTAAQGVTATPPLDQMQKVGEAKLEVLFWDIYDSTLYSATGEFEPDTYPIALNIRYLRNIKADSLVEKTAEEWEKLGFNQEQYQPWLNEITDLFPDISKGDELLLVVNEAQQSAFYFNREPLGQVENREFGPKFLSIWLDENCSYPKLRNQLIGEQK